ncbi:MAG: murein biosynthesis integral membrane protein MurJ [Candidatus Doudnabacteria bacterium]|nr:murein biosynthesis integral membrane protein MurJ [Candidatus Doudnabacteria bacterium]
MTSDNFRQTRNRIGSAAIIIAVFSLLSKILGLARDAIFSHQFGTGPVIDAYFAAFRIPDFVFNLLILGTFSVAFIPIFSEYLIKDKEKANRLANSIINVTLLMIFVFSLLALVFINPLISAIAPGFQGETRELAKTFTKIFLLSPIFLTLSSITSSMLNTHRRFAIVSAAPLLYNASIIAGAVWLYPKFGPMGLAFGVVLGAFLHFIIQVPQLLSLGFRYEFKIDTRQPGFIQFWKLYWPRIFSMGTGQITLLITSIFGSFLGAGALSSFYYANNLQGVFLSIFAVSAALAVFPVMSDLFNEKDMTGLKDVIAHTTIQILYFVIPLSVLMLILRAQVVRLVLGIGQNTNFTFNDVRTVAATLGLFAVSMFAQGLIQLFTRAFYAMQNTRIPVIISFITIAINIVATAILVRKFGVPGLAMAFSITSLIELAILMMELHVKLGNIHDEYLIVLTLKIVISSLVAGIITYITLYIVAPFVPMNKYVGVLTQAIISGLVGSLAYLAVSWVLGLAETRNIISVTRSAVAKAGKPFAYIWSMWS